MPSAGESAAFDAIEALAMSLPEPLNLIPLDIAVVLRLVALYQKNGSIPYEEILKHGATLAVMHGIAALQIQSALQFSATVHTHAHPVQVAVHFSCFCQFSEWHCSLHNLLSLTVR